MGVTGLWRLLEPAGKAVPLETLENKVLAVDISIWLYQMVKGFQDPRGGAVTNAHLLGLFQRLCKLLFYRIKPVFVFDGGVPTLKRMTIIKRQKKKTEAHNTVEQMRKQLLGIVTKQLAVNKVLTEKAKSPNKKSPVKAVFSAVDESLFKLPPAVEATTAAESDESDSDESSASSNHSHIDLHSLDVNSAYFKSLTPRERHDLLTELKETRKQNSWGRIHELPSQSDNFSDYQMNRLLKRRQVQVSLEETEKEMGGHYLSLNELEILLNEEGIDTKVENLPSRRIASNETSNFILIKDVKEALETAAKKQAEADLIAQELSASSSTATDITNKNELGNEFDKDLQDAINLSLQCLEKDIPSGSSERESNVIDLTFLGPDFVQSDSEWSTDEESEGDSSLGNTDLALAKAYMLQNSGLSEFEILRIIQTRSKSGKRELKAKQSKQNNIQSLPNHKETKDDIVNNDFDTRDCSDTKHNEIINLDDNDQLPAVDVPIIKTEICISDSDSESADSFEEVPEITKPSIQLNLKPVLNPIEDDIFSDVFESKNSELSSVECVNEENFESFQQVSGTSSSVPYNTDLLKFPQIDIKNNDDANNYNSGLEIQGEKDVSSTHEAKIREDMILAASRTPEKQIVINTEKDPFTKDIISVSDSQKVQERSDIDIDYVHRGKSDIVAKVSDDLPSSQDAPPATSVTPESSPQKGMTLNEIRHMISYEQNSDSSAVCKNSMDEKMISTDELSLLADDLGVERDKIEKQQSKLDRMGRNISDEMTKDAQDLLTMFGIPFIVAPMEAEAQCAFLESINLTDGTITDDSDIWLFGGKSVYKNFFNQQKHVLQFLSDNIKSCFKLSREQLILLALLVGSDYTVGVNGVGPVTALEILAAFPPTVAELNPPYVALLQGLKKFRSWWGNNRSFGHNALRSKLKNISLAQEFPNYRVVEAYLLPKVDESKENFTWGKPDITALREFTRVKFGWSQNKTDEMLKPVLKRLDEKICQQSIRSFFQTEIKRNAAEENMSKRVKMAVEKMGNPNSEFGDDQGPSKPKKPRMSKEGKEKKTTSKKMITKNNVKEIEVAENADTQENACVITSTSNEEKKLESKNIKLAGACEYPKLYRETIPQREIDKSNIIKNKLKAIELFRTSKKGPGFIKKSKKRVQKPKADAELSESSSD